MTLDLQDASGVKNVNITRVADGANATVRNIADPVEGLSVANSHAPDGNITFNFLNKAVSGADDTVNLTLSNVDVNAVVVQERGNAPAEGFETINLASTGSENEVNVLVAEDLQTLNISGDQELTLGGQTVVRRADGAVEAVRGEAGLANVAGSLSKIDASAFEADLNIVLGAEINAGQDGTSGKAVEFEFIGGKGDDTIVLASTVVGGAVGNTDKIDGGEGQNTVIVTGSTTINAAGTAAAPVANVTNIQELEILSGHDAGAGIGEGDIININANAFDSLSSIFVRNEGQTQVGGNWESAAEGMTVNLTNLTSEQANGITLAHGTTGNSTIVNNIVNIGLKTATGAADTATVTIVDGVNSDPVFNAQIAATAVERVTLVDSDTESNTIHLNQGAFTQAGSTITLQGGAAGQYMNLDSSANGAVALGATVSPAYVRSAGYGRVKDGAVGDNTTYLNANSADQVARGFVATRDAAVATVFYGTEGVANDGVTRHLVENLNAADYAGDVEIRVGDITRADGTTSMNIQTGVGNDTVIFDAIGSTSAGFTSGDTVAMGAGTDTLVLDGNTTTIPGGPRIDHQTSEWDNLSGVDVLRFGNNAGVANVGNNAQVANAGGAYYARIDNDFVSQTDAGDRLTIINNDGDLVNNTESDLVLDLRGLSQDKWVTFVGANGNGNAGISSNRIVVDDISANRNMILNGGDTDVRVNTTAGYVAGNNNVYEVRNTANVSINDLAQTSNFGLINFTNDQAVAQTLTLTLNNTVIEALVDSSSTATTAATQEILFVAATDNGAVASALNIDARAVSGFHSLAVTGSNIAGTGNDVLTLNSNVGGSVNYVNLGNLSLADRVNWTGGSATTTVTIDMGNADVAVVGGVVGTAAGDGFAQFVDGAVTTTHDINDAEIVDLTGLTYLSSVINGTGANETIIGGAGNDVITGGAGVDTFVIGATDSLNTALDTITDYTAGTDKLQLAVTPVSLVASAGADFSTAAAVAATGTTAADLATDIATAVAAQRVIDANFWAQAGDTIAVQITGASVAGNNVTYIVQNQAADTTYDSAADTVVALVGTSTVPTALADFV